MFRVRVVRDVHAKLCASSPLPLALAPDPCPAPPAPPRFCRRGVPAGVPVSRLVSWRPGRCPVAVLVSWLVSRCPGWCPVAVLVSRLAYQYRINAEAILQHYGFNMESSYYNINMIAI